MEQIKEKNEVSYFERKLGNTTYRVTVHFDENSQEAFEDKVKRLIVNECMEGQKK